jgi:hypothetical protein
MRKRRPYPPRNANRGRPPAAAASADPIPSDVLMHLGGPIYFRIRRASEVTLFHAVPGTPICLTLAMLRELVHQLESIPLEERISDQPPVRY